MKTFFTVHGTHCHACKALIEDIVGEMPGVTSCAVDFTTGRTDLEHDAALDWQELKKQIEEIDPRYKVELPTEDKPA